MTRLFNTLFLYIIGQLVPQYIWITFAPVGPRNNPWMWIVDPISLKNIVWYSFGHAKISQHLIFYSLVGQDHSSSSNHKKVPNNKLKQMEWLDCIWISKWHVDCQHKPIQYLILVISLGTWDPLDHRNASTTVVCKNNKAMVFRYSGVI